MFLIWLSEAFSRLLIVVAPYKKARRPTGKRAFELFRFTRACAAPFLRPPSQSLVCRWPPPRRRKAPRRDFRSEEHTSELQSLTNLVCRLLLEKKKKNKTLHLPLLLVHITAS